MSDKPIIAVISYNFETQDCMHTQFEGEPGEDLELKVEGFILSIKPDWPKYQHFTIRNEAAVKIKVKKFLG